MIQLPGLGDCGDASGQCLIGKAETKEDEPQDGLLGYRGMGSGLIDNQAVGVWVIKGEPRFQMRARRRKPTCKHQITTGRVMTQNEAGGILALMAQKKHFLIQAKRQLEFSAVHVIQ